MKKEFTCIVCPNGCHLVIDEETHEVTGNRCPRGAKYAISEITHPTRSLTTTVRSMIRGYPVVSVRTDGEIDKNLIFKAMGEINSYTLKEKEPIGTILIKDLLHTGVNVILTTRIE